MNDEQNLVYIKSQLLCAEIEMNAMIAENKQREILGQSMAYTEDAFMKLIEKYGIYHNAIVSSLCNQGG